MENHLSESMKYHLLMATKRVETVETQIREQNERTALLMDVIGTKFEALNGKLDESYDNINKRFTELDVIGTKFEALNGKLDESYGNINKRFTELGSCRNCNVLIKKKLNTNENLCKAFEDKMSLVNKLDEEIDQFQETLLKRITDFETAAETLLLSHFADFKEIFEQSVVDVKDLVAGTKKKLQNDNNEVDSDDDNELDSDNVNEVNSDDDNEVDSGDDNEVDSDDDNEVDSDDGMGLVGMFETDT